MKFFALVFIFIGLTEAANITCNFSGGIPWPSCNTFTITPLSSADEEITILDQPSNYVDITKNSLDFDKNSPPKYIPSRIFKYFPNLMSFSATNASIIALITDNINNCETMSSINIIQNSISHIPAKFASGCHFVEYLMLSYNKIRTIDEKAFVGLESLKMLQVSYNEISCIPALLFKQSFGLNQIEFSYNKINALHPAIFKDLTQLQMASFGSNQISYIPNLEFEHTGTLGMGGSVMINLWENPVIAIDPEFLTTIFFSRTSPNAMGPITLSFYSGSPNATSCIDINKNPNNQNLYMIGSYNWVQNHVAFKYRTTCYKNFNAEMASNSLVNCGCGSE